MHPDPVGEIDTPVKPSRVMHAGLDAWTPVESEVINELGLRRAGADALASRHFFASGGLDCKRRDHPSRDSFRC
jgi:hypothetical protein